MQYKGVKQGVFLCRPNRFVAHVNIHGNVEICHVKNTGRCKELFVENATVFVQPAENKNRKTKFDVIAVKKGDKIINVDSQIPNAVFEEWANKGNLWPEISLCKREKVFGNSRFDFYIETPNEKAFVEVKGVTLEENGVVKFPDAPTLRGVKHIEELCLALEAGYSSYLVFIVQMENVQYFTPNNLTHPEFGAALKRAQEKGVNLLCLSCAVSANSIEANRVVEIKL